MTQFHCQSSIPIPQYCFHHVWQMICMLQILSCSCPSPYFLSSHQSALSFICQKIDFLFFRLSGLPVQCNHWFTTCCTVYPESIHITSLVPHVLMLQPYFKVQLKSKTKSKVILQLKKQTNKQKTATYIWLWIRIYIYVYTYTSSVRTFHLW